MTVHAARVRTPPPPARRAFALVLAGGGARGSVHAGVLRGLERLGLEPTALVGVSMGAIVGVTYSLNPDWYRALVAADMARVPGLVGRGRDVSGVRRLVREGRYLEGFVRRWGALSHGSSVVKAMLRELTLGRDLTEARLPIAVVATDLVTGGRVVVRDGDAAEAAYASAALAGILPPLRRAGALLADGGYADGVPIDVARGLGDGPVIVVHPAGAPGLARPRTGLEALQRSLEVSLAGRSRERYREADLDLAVPLAADVTSFGLGDKRRGIAAGIRAVRASGPARRRLVDAPQRAGTASTAG